MKKIGSDQLCELLLICYQLLRTGLPYFWVSQTLHVQICPCPLTIKLASVWHPRHTYAMATFTGMRHDVLEDLFFYLFHRGVMCAMNVLSEADLQLVH